MNRAFILAIESTCDNSSLCLLDDNNQVIFYRNVNQESMMKQYGGFVPNLMMEMHIIHFLNIIFEFCEQRYSDIDYVVVSAGPGVIMSLNIGHGVALALACYYGAKLIYVDHIEAHAWSHAITMKNNPDRPFLSLIASGGHSLLLLVLSIDNLQVIASSADDAPGEVFDKIAVKLDLNPATGASVDSAARSGTLIKKLVNINRLPRNNLKYYTMSFSGIKTRVINFIQDKNNNYSIADICISLEYLIYKEIYFAMHYCLKQYGHLISYIACAGGVLANTAIRSKLIADFSNYEINHAAIEHAQDNAIMIAYLGYLTIKRGRDRSVCCDSNIPYSTFLMLGVV